ncbi:MAG: hypothetical protein R2864_06335 [Syntrophotaleaceae bacterium]
MLVVCRCRIATATVEEAFLAGYYGRWVDTLTGAFLSISRLCFRASS